MKPLISIILPTFNNASTIGAALRSILDQTLTNLEVIVVDDASTDGTLEASKNAAAGDPRVHYIQAPDDPERFDARLRRNINAGWSARNRGFALAQGEYLTFQDGDDVSLLNRLELQLGLLRKHDAIHLTTSWIPWENNLVGTRHTGPLPSPALGPKEIYRLAEKTKGFIPKVSPRLSAMIPFHLKRKRVINKLFFGSLESYPGAGNSPFFKREVIEKVQFRPLKDRIWPSFMGRGADRDFNFQVAETFKNSYFFNIPLYLWDTR